MPCQAGIGKYHAVDDTSKRRRQEILRKILLQNRKKTTYDGKCLHLNFPYGIIMIAVLL